MFAKVENGVTNRAKSFAGKREKTQFWHAEIFHFFEPDRLLFARVEIGLTKFTDKNNQKRRKVFCV